MNILSYLQKVGRALMVPVATLPAAAILMGVGYWIDPVSWGGDNALADAPRDKCAHFREINGIAAAFQHLQKNYNPIASSFL